MALLETLKIVSNPITSTPSAQQLRRNKLIVKLQEQIAIAEAQLNNSSYHRMRWITVADAEGEPRRVQRPVRIKKWWFKNTAGSVLLSVRYGAKQVPLMNGKTAIEVGTMADVPKVLQTIVEAVEAGELDHQLGEIASERKPSLKKPVKITNSGK
jgi:hypothetical protein